MNTQEEYQKSLKVVIALENAFIIALFIFFLGIAAGMGWHMKQLSNSGEQYGGNTKYFNVYSGPTRCEPGQ